MSQSTLLLWSVPKNITKIATPGETRTEGEKYIEDEHPLSPCEFDHTVCNRVVLRAKRCILFWDSICNTRIIYS